MAKELVFTKYELPSIGTITQKLQDVSGFNVPEDEAEEVVVFPTPFISNMDGNTWFYIITKKLVEIEP